MCNTTDRFSNLMTSLVKIASKSLVNYQHAAYIIKGGKIVAYSENKITGIKNEHAEYAAINNYLKSYGYYMNDMLHKQWGLQRIKGTIKQ